MASWSAPPFCWTTKVRGTANVLVNTELAMIELAHIIVQYILLVVAVTSHDMYMYMPLACVHVDLV